MSIKKIAEKTGYSTATVSRILKGDKTLNVTEQCRRMILEEAKQTNDKKYREESIWNLKDKLIGIVPLGLESTGRGELQDPYYLYLKTGIEWQLEKLKIGSYRTISLKSKEDYAKLDELDGLILIGKKVLDFDNYYLAKMKHIVIADSDYLYPHFDSVTCDLEMATNMAIANLVEAGYQRIGYIGAHDYINDFQKNLLIETPDIRSSTYRENLKKRKLDASTYLFLGTAFSANEGYRLTKESIENKQLPDAFLVGSDPMARGVYAALSDSDYQVGKDIGIISIDGIEDSKFMIPPLSTMKIDSFEMGKVAIMKLVEQFLGRKNPTRTTLSVEFKKGESF